MHPGVDGRAVGVMGLIFVIVSLRCVLLFEISVPVGTYFALEYFYLMSLTIVAFNCNYIFHSMLYCVA